MSCIQLHEAWLKLEKNPTRDFECFWMVDVDDIQIVTNIVCVTNISYLRILSYLPKFYVIQYQQ